MQHRMPMDDRLWQTALDPADEHNHPLLSDLQGNILKSHGRKYSVHLFLRFKADPAAVRAWIREFAETAITSALTQHQATLAYRDCQTRCREQGKSAEECREACAGDLFASLLLSAAGYRALGFEEEQLPPDKRFRLGMKHRDTRAWLHDPPLDTWEEGFRQDLHALLILAHSLDPQQATDFQTRVQAITSEVSHVADIVVTDYGRALIRDGQVVEHFGFADGISQPLFLAEDVQNLSRRGWDASASLGLVLAPDLQGRTAESYGSYVVYRKLAQDVARFNALVQQVAGQSGIDPELAAAYMVGRFKDGTPVVQQPRPAFSGQPATVDPRAWNAFDYRDDTEGARCPFHAHIRKVNPRGEKHRQMLPPFRRWVARRRWPLIFYPKLKAELAHMEHVERASRIARRGITYGPERPAGGEEVGLLFLCAQADIARQFEFMQAMWASKNTFVRDGVGLDPIVGQGYQQAGGQNWPRAWGDPGHAPELFDISGCVTLKGGEYFFAASISFLTSL